MSIQVENEQATIEEATAILLERLPTSKVARLLAAWRVGQGDYLAAREKTFYRRNPGQPLRKSEGHERRQVTKPAKTSSAN